MTLKSSYELLIKSYEQFQVFWNQVKNRPHISRAPFGVQRTIYTHDRKAIVLCGWAEKSKKISKCLLDSSVKTYEQFNYFHDSNYVQKNYSAWNNS